ncbi:MAG: response regulator [Synergistaceae bacterium]|nr:response regulator [Synergistaceae bacterium]
MGEQNLHILNEYLFKYLRNVMYAPSEASLDLDRIPDELQMLGKGLQFFCECAMESAALAKSLSKGVLGAPRPSRQNEMAAPLKSLHATLSHLTWQTQQVAKGDYNQRVDFMGDFADAFNTMVRQLEERWRSLEDLYLRSNSHIRFIRKLGENMLSISGSGHLEAVTSSLRDLCETFGCAILSLWQAECGAEGEGGGDRFNRLFHWPADGGSPPFTVETDWPKEWLGELAAGRQVFVNRAESLEGLFPAEFRSLMLIPLMVGGKLWGFMAMPRHSEEPCTEEEMSVITAGGILIVSAILEKETTDSLVAAKDAALEATRVKSEFLSRMSHEMRTPMNAIIGMTHIAQRAADPEKIRFCLSRIETSSAHLLALINDVLDMSKIEAGKLELDSAPFDVEKMLMKAYSVVGEKAEQKNQTLRIVMGKDMRMGYIGDEMRLSQVVINLLSNAVKFTPENGKIRLSAEETERGENRSRLRFAVSDSGIGIGREQAKHLFNPFQQADPSIAKRYGGTGLGLAISKKIVEQMNGHIEVSSEPGKGAVFTFDIELARAPRQGAGAAFADFGPDFDSRKFRALAADADPESLEQIRAAAGNAGVVPDTAPDGPSAVSLVNDAVRSGSPYDIIFLDLELPNGDGGGLAAVLSFDPAADRNAVVLMTTLLKWNKIEAEAKRAGIRRFLTKPLFPSSILDAMGVLRGKDAKDPGASGGFEESAERVLDFSGKRMLLVDDVDLNRMILRELLSGTHLAIDEAADGETALSLFGSSPENHYDIVFMDIQMPGMDGYETTRRIREMKRSDAETVNIVALTAAAYKEDVEKAMRMGMNRHLSKPIDIGEVRALLEELLTPSRRLNA